VTDLWRPLEDELRHWQIAGRVATFWWRDDDAERRTSQLDTLLELAPGHPLALAVVPARLDPALAETLSSHPRVVVWQHGWAHANHAPTGAQMCELGDGWPLTEMAVALRKGHTRLREAFGDRFLPVLVPPWNRMTPALVSHLPDIGLTGISLGTGRHSRLAHPRVFACHAQVDLADWTRDGKFVGTEMAVRKIVIHLVARRLGYRDGHEPTGILTHHLQMDADTVAFLRELLAFLDGMRCVAWLDIADVMRQQKRWADARLWLRRHLGRHWPDTPTTTTYNGGKQAKLVAAGAVSDGVGNAHYM
jgi:hypothetical protein